MDSGQLLLVCAAGMLVVAAIAQTAAAGITGMREAVAFGALVALGELFRITLPGNREAAPIATAGALAYTLLLRVGDRPAPHSAMQVVATTAVGMVVGALLHVAAGRPTSIDAMARRLLARPLRPEEKAVVRATLDDLLAFYKDHAEDANKLIAVGESKPDPALDPAELAGWTVIANQMMNLDEVLNK
jgi:hypothetical protein